MAIKNGKFCITAELVQLKNIRNVLIGNDDLDNDELDFYLDDYFYGIDEEDISINRNVLTINLVDCEELYSDCFEELFEGLQNVFPGIKSILLDGLEEDHDYYKHIKIVYENGSIIENLSSVWYSQIEDDDDNIYYIKGGNLFEDEDDEDTSIAYDDYRDIPMK